MRSISTVINAPHLIALEHQSSLLLVVSRFDAQRDLPVYPLRKGGYFSSVEKFKIFGVD